LLRLSRWFLGLHDETPHRWNDVSKRGPIAKELCHQTPARLNRRKLFHEDEGRNTVRHDCSYGFQPTGESVNDSKQLE
jgi:hypothetical protein